MSKSKIVLENDDESRYVIYPIKYNEIWDFYKKAVTCFWTVEE